MPETRYEQLKKYGLIAFVVLFLAIPIASVTPWGPGMVRSYIDKHNPPGQPVKPWATEWMYKLGRFYSLTLRDDDARQTYMDLFEWYFEDPREVPKQDVYVGLALFHYGKLLIDTGHIQKGIQKMEQFLARWGEDPNMDQEIVHLARNRVATSKYRTKPQP